MELGFGHFSREWNWSQVIVLVCLPQLQKVKDDRAFYPNPTSDQIFPEKEIGFDLAFS